MKCLLQRSQFHRKYVTASLIVVMSQNRASHNRQVGIRTRKIAWKLLYDSQQTLKTLTADSHGTMLAI